LLLCKVFSRIVQVDLVRTDFTRELQEVFGLLQADFCDLHAHARLYIVLWPAIRLLAEQVTVPAALSWAGEQIFGAAAPEAALLRRSAFHMYLFMQLAAAALPSSLRTAGELHNTLLDKKYLVSTRLRNLDKQEGGVVNVDN
jgi:hypothetical protein